MSAPPTEARRRRRPDRRVVEVGGADRVDYLQRMLTQDVARLEPGAAVDACVLTPQGRLVGVPIVLHTGDAHLLDLDASTVADVVGRLERTVITEDVTFRDLGTGLARFTVAGADAPAAIAAWSGEAPEAGRHVVRDGARVLRRDLGSVPAYELFLAEGEAPPELPDLPDDAWTEIRLTERLPAWGAELGPDVLPLEARLAETAVSFSKGCFPGQEPAAMAWHRGHPARLLVRVALEGAPLRAGDALQADGREVGRLTTVAGDRALAYVRWDRVKEGAVLEVEGGATARLLDGRNGTIAPGRTPA